jgi:hypothetical protein
MDGITGRYQIILPGMLRTPGENIFFANCLEPQALFCIGSNQFAFDYGRLFTRLKGRRVEILVQFYSY